MIGFDFNLQKRNSFNCHWVNHDLCNLACTVDLTLYNKKSLGMRELRWREKCRNKLFPRSFPTKNCLQVVLLPKINFYKCKLPSCYHFSFHANTWSIYLLWPVSMVFFINWQVTWSPYLVAVEAAVEDVVIQENENDVFRHKVSGFSW